MYRTLNVGLTAGAALLLLTAQPGLAQDAHLAQAVTHAQQAAAHGGMGHASVLVEHANQALTHANMAPDDNPHTVAAIASLTDAVTHGNMDHAPVATGMANTGLASLQVAVHVHQRLGRLDRGLGLGLGLEDAGELGVGLEAIRESPHILEHLPNLFVADLY